MAAVQPAEVGSAGGKSGGDRVSAGECSNGGGCGLTDKAEAGGGDEYAPMGRGGIGLGGGGCGGKGLGGSAAPPVPALK